MALYESEAAFATQPGSLAHGARGVSRSPELIPVTIESSTCSGVAADTAVSFRDTVVCYGMRRRYIT